jgi:hypothetical protein
MCAHSFLALLQTANVDLASNLLLSRTEIANKNTRRSCIFHAVTEILRLLKVSGFLLALELHLRSYLLESRTFTHGYYSLLHNYPLLIP